MMEKIPGVNCSANPERYRKIQRIIPKAHKRMDRRYENIRLLMESGFGPNSEERKIPHMLDSEAQHLIDRLNDEYGKAWYGK